MEKFRPSTLSVVPTAEELALADLVIIDQLDPQYASFFSSLDLKRTQDGRYVANTPDGTRYVQTYFTSFTTPCIGYTNPEGKMIGTPVPGLDRSHVTRNAHPKDKKADKRAWSFPH